MVLGKLNNMSNAIKVSTERFKQEVDLWKLKGHEHVVKPIIYGHAIMLEIRDYVEPSKVYFIPVLDYQNVDIKVEEACKRVQVGD